MYKRILVAIDDSKMAEGTLREAFALATTHRAQVRVVHAVESPYACPDSWYTGIGTELEALRETWPPNKERVR